jgi:hypothetical protein
VIGTDRHRPDKLFEIFAVLFTVAEGDTDAFVGFVVVGIPIDGHRGGIVVAYFGFDLKDPDHILGNQN